MATAPRARLSPMAFELSRLAAVHGNVSPRSAPPPTRGRGRERLAAPASPMLADAVLEEARDVRQRALAQGGRRRAPRAALVADLPRFQRAAPTRGRCVW